MQSEIDLLLGTEIDSLVKLEILLYLHQRPGTVGSPQQVASQIRRDVAEVAAALEQLSQSELVERFAFGSGRHIVYGPSEDAHVQELLGFLHEQYHAQPEARSRIIQRTLGRQRQT